MRQVCTSFDNNYQLEFINFYMKRQKNAMLMQHMALYVKTGSSTFSVERNPQKSAF